VTPTRSLRTRLAWSASAVVALWITVLTVGANLLLGAALAHQADTLLQARAEATAATVQVAAAGQVTVPQEREDAALDVGTWIFAADGAAVESPSGTASGLDARAAALAGRGSVTVDVGLTEPVRLLALPIQGGGHQVATVVTSTSLAPYEQLRRLAWIASAVLAVGLLVGVHVVLRANVGRALRPVQEMTAQADRWSADDVDRRFGESPRPAELDALAHTLDAVLQRLGAVLRRERQLSDELSHELRTPLTEIQGEVDLLVSRPQSPGELATAHASIARATETMKQIIDTLIASARATSTPLTGRSQLRSALDHLAARLQGERPDLDVVVTVDPDVCVGVESALLERLLSPIFENAGRYAVRRVQVSSHEQASRVDLVISDDGPGIPPDLAERVFEPGWRADPTDGHPGAGLGLPLSRRLAEAAGGSIRVTDGATGGRFAIELPAA
jgi:signal transduction histidine kinase